MNVRWSITFSAMSVYAFVYLSPPILVHHHELYTGRAWILCPSVFMSLWVELLTVQVRTNLNLYQCSYVMNRNIQHMYFIIPPMLEKFSAENGNAETIRTDDGPRNRLRNTLRHGDQAQPVTWHHTKLFVSFLFFSGETFMSTCI